MASYLLIYLNWRLITLQYCGGFCHTLTWISLGCTCVPILTPLPPPSPSHPSGLSQCTGFECPVSCIKLGLAICFTYGSVHVSMLFSQIILPSPSPTESKLCSLYLCLFRWLTYKVIITIFLNYIYIWVNILYWYFSFCLTLLCIIGSDFIYLIRTDSNAFFLKAE